MRGNRASCDRVFERTHGIDGDGDGVGNACDNCPGAPNPAQEDCNQDGQGDACDPDPGEGDHDGDGVCDGTDNCPDDHNPDQIDTDGDGFGDECDQFPGVNPIPAASGWAVIVMALVLLTAAKIYFACRRLPVSH